jgi:hypothetical protein
MNHTTTKILQLLKATLQFIITYIPYQLLTFNFRLQVTGCSFFLQYQLQMISHYMNLSNQIMEL